MKKAEDMKWIVHPYSYEKRSTEVSVVHESDFHGLKSYGWFSETKILIAADSHHGEMHAGAKVALRKFAEELCEKMNNYHPLPISKIQAAIDAKQKSDSVWQVFCAGVSESAKKEIEQLFVDLSQLK